MISDSCEVCQGDNYVLIGCCDGRECGCMGRPVAVRACLRCNPDGDKEPSEELRSQEFFNHLELLA